MRFYELQRPSLNDPIIAAFGGEAKAGTMLWEIYELMARQTKGEQGVLLNQGLNVFYVRDDDGVLQTVSINWYNDGWRIGAGSLECPLLWFGAYRVFSHSPVLETEKKSAPAQV